MIAVDSQKRVRGENRSALVAVKKRLALGNSVPVDGSEIRQGVNVSVLRRHRRGDQLTRVPDAARTAARFQAYFVDGLDLSRG